MKLLQVPNAPLIIAISGLIISKVPNAYTIAIIIWAYEEITSGINWARKLLGLVVIFTVAYSLFNQL